MAKVREAVALVGGLLLLNLAGRWIADHLSNTGGVIFLILLVVAAFAVEIVPAIRQRPAGATAADAVREWGLSRRKSFIVLGAVGAALLCLFGAVVAWG